MPQLTYREPDDRCPICGSASSLYCRMHGHRPTGATEPPRARRDDPDTSKAAADKLDAQRLQVMILRMLRDRVLGLTTLEMAEISGERVNSFSPRMVPLESRGLVVRGTERRQPAIPRSRPGIVWRITPAGLRIVAEPSSENEP